MFLSDQIWGICFGIFVLIAMRHFPCCLFKVVDIHRVVVGYSSTLGLCGANKHIHFMPHHIYKIIQAKVCIHLLFFVIFFHICIYLWIRVFEYFSISLCGTTSTARSDQRWPEIWFPHCAPLLRWYKVSRSQIVSAFLNICMCPDISKWVVSVCPI